MALLLLSQMKKEKSVLLEETLNVKTKIKLIL